VSALAQAAHPDPLLGDGHRQATVASGAWADAPQDAVADGLHQALPGEAAEKSADQAPVAQALVLWSGLLPVVMPAELGAARALCTPVVVQSEE